MKHFVLVHGVGHGAWCWYKLASLLKSAGHRVTTLDLCASGINTKELAQLDSVFDYVQPLMELMESVSPKEKEKEKVILVGHSFGGIAISLAMEAFPAKIIVAVFVTAVMPNIHSPPATIIQELFRRTPLESLLDCHFSFDKGVESPPTSLVFGSDFVETKMYKCCQSEDVMLAQMLLRPATLFIEDLIKDTLITKDKYGSVNRVYVVCDEDEVMNKEFQSWMIENSPVVQLVKTIQGADHMVMLSKPAQLCLCLEEIAERYPH